jgi:hypothetical protein
LRPPWRTPVASAVIQAALCRPAHSNARLSARKPCRGLPPPALLARRHDRLVRRHLLHAARLDRRTPTFRPFSRAISSRCAATTPFSADTSPNSRSTRAPNSSGDRYSISIGPATPALNQVHPSEELRSEHTAGVLPRLPSMPVVPSQFRVRDGRILQRVYCCDPEDQDIFTPPPLAP